MELIDFLEPRVAAGQRDLSDTIRFLVHWHSADLLARFDFDDDPTFLEPQAFLFFAHPDARQRVTLAEVLVERSNVQPGDADLCARVGVAHRYTTLYDPLFGDHAAAAAASVAPMRHRYLDSVGNALSMIDEVWPEFAGLLAGVLRRIVLFDVAEMNSFASPTAHGCIFINTALGDNETFFVEDIAHQAGHVLFTAAALDWSSILSVEPTCPLASLTGNRSDARTISVALHGIVTEALMSQMLGMLSARDVVPPQMRHELRGRLAFIMFRYHQDLRAVAGLDVFTSQGRLLMAILAASCARLVEELGPIWTSVDLSGQPYNFSYPTFRARNQPRGQSCPA